MSHADLRCWGVYRELAHSPGRETDDAEILRATGEILAAEGYAVSLKTPDELPESPSDSDVPPFLFVMCERVAIVERLAAWERSGARIVNRPYGIRNTDRERAIDLLTRHGVPFPESALVATSAGPAVFPGACWIKRGDVHSTQDGDVAFAADADALSGHLARLASRGIARAVVQRHVPGDLVKFYGVAGLDDPAQPSWFRWFYHRDQVLSKHPFDERVLEAATTRAAAALGLEVYGGDAIVSEDGAISVIDVNAWPSFALFRAEAAARIAALLAARFARAAVRLGTAR